MERLLVIIGVAGGRSPGSGLADAEPVSYPFRLGRRDRNRKDRSWPTLVLWPGSLTTGSTGSTGIF